ncbi:MAG: glutaredoxin domain-containing protein [Xanthomonadales bacterium]|nr:glutaredoxin domain-containing protein [Xanthomonadales bacterium]
MSQTDHAVTPTLPESAAESAEQFLDRVLSDVQIPLLIFTREMCEFCRAARKFFASIEAPYRIIELDSEEYQANGLNRKIRALLQARTHSGTVPQIFIAGQFVGGATDGFDAWRSGEFQKKLNEAGVPFKESADLNPDSFLSGWLH